MVSITKGGSWSESEAKAEGLVFSAQKELWTLGPALASLWVEGPEQVAQGWRPHLVYRSEVLRVVLGGDPPHWDFLTA